MSVGIIDLIKKGLRPFSFYASQLALNVGIIDLIKKGLRQSKDRLDLFLQIFVGIIDLIKKGLRPFLILSGNRTRKSRYYWIGQYLR